MKPRVFISYSWTSPGHQGRIRQWAEQLVSDGIDVILDIWDLKEGDDKYAFMESMVVDESVTHVLVFCDSAYASKADARKAGVGTESQIISQEVYSKVKQSKFIPIACEFDEEGEPLLPTFFRTRIWIDFSSPEAANDNWEQLVRLLYGRPANEKPSLGTPPSYITADVKVPASPALTKFSALKQAILQERPTVSLYRADFLSACYSYADALRIRERPDVTEFGRRVLEDCGKLKIVRDHIVDWVLLESAIRPGTEFDEALVSVLEQLLELKARPAELNAWNDTWFEAHQVFAYETFLYIVAALLKTRSFDTLHVVLTSHYLLPSTDASGGGKLVSFRAFYGHSDSLQILAQEGTRLHSPAAELVRRQADRTDVPFVDLMQGEVMVLLMAFISEDSWWYPQTLLYSSRHGAYPFFIRATRHRDFQKLARVTGIDNGDALRAAVKEGHKRFNVQAWNQFWYGDRTFWTSMNMDELDTIS